MLSVSVACFLLGLLLGHLLFLAFERCIERKRNEQTEEQPLDLAVGPDGKGGNRGD